MSPTPSLPNTHVLILPAREQALPHNYRVSALQAFWPAVQVAAGDVERAESTYDSLFGLWKKYGALPDFYDVQSES